MEKTRVHILANELGVTSKAILEKCRAEGLGEVVRNHMTALSAGLEATIREWFSQSETRSAVETSEHIDLSKVRASRRRRRTATSENEQGGSVLVEEAPGVEPLEPEERSAAPEGAIEAPAVEPPAAPVVTAEPVSAPVIEPPPISPKALPIPEPVVETGPIVTEPSSPPCPVTVESPPITKVAAEAPPVAPPPSAPAGPKHIPAPAKITGPRVVRYDTPERDIFVSRSRPPMPREPVTFPDQDRPGKGSGRKKIKGEEPGTVKAPHHRRGMTPDSVVSEKLQEWRDQDLAERRERLRVATGRKIHRRRGDDDNRQTQSGPKRQATLHEPITVRDFCAATGINQILVTKALLQKLEVLANINTVLSAENAQLLGLEFGIEIEIVAAKTALDKLEEEFAAIEHNNLVPRPPVVTIMGHVDHGKTSLLDYIRKARIAHSEDGGITQHIGSYHYEKGKVKVTFLDTPGHAAFTAMRERGATLTDIVVLVVAANDGVMPQTVEAINHAKAAKVPIAVALNKIDLGRDNVLRILGQLAEHGLSPVAWGGDTEVIETSATTGEGIDHLLETLMTMAELLDLKADPTVPAKGTVIEAETKPGAGAVVRALIQQGTLKVGDHVVCGAAGGKVRALLDDRGRRLKSVGPAMPVEIWGLDDVPHAGDHLYQLQSATRVKQIAEEVRQARLTESRLSIRKARSLAEIFARKDAEEIPELNVIIRADVQGSIDAIEHLLSELPTEKVKLTIRHAGVGAITESDVLLAAASDAIIIGFRVEPTAGAKRMIEEKGVDVRSYRVIYEVADEITRAMEGLLTPEEHLESRATVEVRNVFRISKVGLVAGCYVTSGVVARHHVVKLIRDGVVVRENTPIASLRHFKDDVKEVRAGKECGITLEGFSDIHVGDVMETFERVRVARSLT